MHTSTVRVVPSILVFGGWKGELRIDDDVLTIEGVGAGKHLSVDVKDVTGTSFNSNNGLWVFRLGDGSKLRMQSAGRLLSTDRSPAGKAANEMIKTLLARHNVRGFSV
jgi:hypothetical protein